MLKNYFQTAARSAWQHKTSTLISLGGLALGVASFFLIATYILNELSFDRFHARADRIMFVSFSYKSPSDAEAVHSGNTPTALVPVAKRLFPGVEGGVRMYDYGSRTVAAGNRLFSEKNMRLADPAFFRIFSFTFLQGDPATALNEPHSLVLTRSAAKKYFGDADALGRLLRIDSVAWKVTGVIEDVPSFSSLQFDIMGSYNTLSRSANESWSAANDLSFLLLRSATDRAAVQQGINTYLEKTFPQEFKSGFRFWFDLEPLKTVHLFSQTAGAGNTGTLYVLGAVALLLLVIACINFTNLMTATSAERAREIGVRKVMGAQRQHIFFQFMAESAILSVGGIALGLLTAYALLPAFNRLTGLSLSLTAWNPLQLAAVLLVLLLTLTVLAGAWPALVIARIGAVPALRKGGVPMSGTAVLRKFLVVFQFTVSLVFIMATLAMQGQLHFLRHTHTGLDRSRVLVLDAGRLRPARLQALKHEMMKSGAVEAVTASYDSPVNVQGGYTIKVEGRTDNKALSITALPVDRNFVSALGLKIVQGSNFTLADEAQAKLGDKDRRHYAFMLNETALRALGITPEEAVGKRVELNGRRGEIKAVLADFHFAPLRQLIAPIVVFTEYDWFGELLVKLDRGPSNRSLDAVRAAWTSVNPGAPFSFHFLDEEYDALYRSEERTGAILRLFSLITILVSCLGLFGLAIFMSSRRTKEIGIRKVLGATATQITVLLSSDFMRLVLLAGLLACPLAWFGVHRWLEGFAYRIPMPYGRFLLAIGIGILIAWVTVGYHAIRTAFANPVGSLRSE